MGRRVWTDPHRLRRRSSASADVRFSPGAEVRRLGRRALMRGGRAFVEAPESYFLGKWEDRHPLNVPGPFYGAMTDTCCDGPGLAPASLLYDSDGAGFVWRQPRDEAETFALMTGASSDPFSGYACDGDQHWTPDLVRAWWRDREAQQPAIDLIVIHVAGPRPELPTEYADLLFRCLPIGGYSAEEREAMRGIVNQYVRYRKSEMRTDLRSYVFFLENGVYPAATDELPPL